MLLRYYCWVLCLRSCISSGLGRKNRKRIKSYSWNMTWCTCTRQVWHGGKIWKCNCWTSVKNFIKNQTFSKTWRRHLCENMWETRFSQNQNQGGIIHEVRKTNSLFPSRLIKRITVFKHPHHAKVLDAVIYEIIKFIQIT